MSPPLGRVQPALARREGHAPGMARDGARRVSRKGAICAARGDTDEIATPGAITSLSASWALAVGRGGWGRRGGGGVRRGARAREGGRRRREGPGPGALGAV